MPIRPEDRARYPAGWKAIRARILARAGNACECRGQCGQVHLPRWEGATPLCLAPGGVFIARRKAEPAVWHFVEAMAHDRKRGEPCKRCGAPPEVAEDSGRTDFCCPKGEVIVGSNAPYEAFQPPIWVVLTIAHLDHTPENCDDGNLLALCQRCHLLLDKDQHRESARLGRDRRRGQRALF